MLVALQNHLAGIYQADCGHDVTDYLITDRKIAAAIGIEKLNHDVEETVLVAEYDDGLALSLFLDPALLKRLDGEDPMKQLRADLLADVSTVLEGVSHFNYLAWCAGQDKTVTLLELELQAEVDKFVATMLLAMDQNDLELVRCLHGRLFNQVSFHESLDSDQRHRYKMANDYAARFCHRIYERIGFERGLRELREFYRMTQPEKISYIHSLAWNQPVPAGH